MSLAGFLERVKRFLFHQEERPDGNDDDYVSTSNGNVSRRSSIPSGFCRESSAASFSVHESDSTRSHTYTQNHTTSYPVNSIRREQTPQLTSGGRPIKHEVESSCLTLDGATWIKAVDRIDDVPPNLPTSSRPPQSSTNWIASSIPSPSPLSSAKIPSKQSPFPPLHPTSVASKPSPTISKPPLATSGSTSFSPRPPTSDKPSVSSPKPPSPSPIFSASYCRTPSSSHKSLSSISSTETTTFCPKPSASSQKPPSSSSNPSRCCSGQSPSSSSPKPPPSFKPTQFPSSHLFADQQRKETYAYLRKDSLPIYMIPKNIEDHIKRDIVPGVLHKPLTPSTYKDYFAALLYAEDYYIEKWSGFELKDVTLELHEAAVKWSGKNKCFSDSVETDNSVAEKRHFVKFDIDSLIEKGAFREAVDLKDPPKRPFLLSRDFVFAQPLGRKIEPFKGAVYRVMRRGIVLAEFAEDFLSQHHSKLKYDISFSFNRVCLKRAHQAISDASDLLFRHFLFPDNVSKIVIPKSSTCFRNSTVHDMLNIQGIPHLVEGPLSTEKVRHERRAFSIEEVRSVEGILSDEEEMADISRWQLTGMGMFIVDAVLQMYWYRPEYRILICAPMNSTCDRLMTSLKKDIPESKMFRANAAFRDIEAVTVDVLPTCLYVGECFACPSLEELKQYRVISSTFMSSYRLRKEGITAGHFDCIFLVDASSATEPEALVALANLANERTVVFVTGAPGNRSGWVRSDIGRKHGLRISYFERLCTIHTSVAIRC